MQRGGGGDSADTPHSVNDGKSPSLAKGDLGGGLLKNTPNSVNALNLSENSKENSQILQDDNFANAKFTHPQTPSAREGALKGEPSAQQGALPLANSTSQNEPEIILDFFAGSATTAHAVMELNSQDNANRRFILVQLDEKIDEKKSKTAFDFCKNELKSENPTIFDITKERIIRAGAKIASLNSSQDLGFKIYELTPSIKAQDANLYNFLNQEHKNALLETFRLDLGIALHIPNETVNLDDYEAIRVNERLFLLDTGFKTKHLKCLIEKIDKENFIIKEVIYLNNAFESARIRELEEGLRSYSNKKGIKISLNARFL
ncbi:hypothetical protein DMC01_06880 [Campylobacter troglodytis]|nr:hypothetical protein DMC01_06880 [Campylobacter troglodytis]